MKKWLVSLMLCVSMSMGLVACGGSKAPVSESSTVKETTVGTENTATEKVEETKKIEKIVFWSNNFATNEATRDYFCEKFYEDTGVVLEWVGFPKEDYEDVLTASLMSCDEDDLPDIIAAPGELGVYIRQELLYDVAPLIENNEGIKALIERNPALTSEYTMDDGSIFALAASNFQSMTFWRRQDIFDELGIDEITSLDDFTETLRTIKAAHPEMIALTAPNSLDAWECVSNWFGVKYTVHKNADGIYVDPTLTDEYKEFMDYVKMLYSEGLVDKELPTNTSYGTIRTKFHTGEAAMVLMWDSNYKNLFSGLEKNGIAGTVAYTPAFDNPDVENGVFGINYSAPSSPFVLTTGVADEEAQQIFDTFFNWMFLTESGILTSSLGPQGYNWDIVDGTYTDLIAGADIGTKPQDNPPMDPAYSYPFKQDPMDEIRFGLANEIMGEVVKRADFVMTDLPGVEHVEYGGISSDLDSYRTELFYLYVTGQNDYDQFVKDYTAKAAEYELDRLLQEMNK